MKLRKVLSLFVALVMMFEVLPLSSLATEIADATENVEVAAGEIVVEINSENTSDYSINDSEVVVTDISSNIGNDELFEGYIEQLFSVDNGIMLLSDWGSSYLSGINLMIYNSLKSVVESIAAGEQTSAIVTLTLTADYSALGASSYSDAVEAFNDQVDYQSIYSYLRYDCPYDLYWHDNETGLTIGVSYADEDSTLYVKLTFTFAVYSDYQNSSDASKVNASKVTIAKTAAANAQKIVSKYSSYSDINKLTVYKNEICSLVSYEEDADVSVSGDYWGLVYVFDGDSSTNVVCEGYTKAFQYLCDLSDFDDASCWTVKGSFTDKDGGHAWNIVSLNGVNYLVDVTNSDTGAIGQDGELFLVCASDATSSSSTGYSFTIDGSVVEYQYNSDTLGMYSTSMLTLGSVSTDNTLISGKDWWSFANSGSVFAITTILGVDFYGGKYYLTDDDFESLVTAAGGSNTVRELLESRRKRKWTGSCYGMSTVVCLAKTGVIDIDDIQSGNDYLYSIDFDKSVESYINYWHLQSKLPEWAEMVSSYMDMYGTSSYLYEDMVVGNKEIFNDIIEMAKTVDDGGSPILFTFVWWILEDGKVAFNEDSSPQTDAHTIVIYGIKEGSWSYSGYTYDICLLTYDPCYPNGNSGNEYIYVNSNTGDWTIPAYANEYFSGSPLSSMVYYIDDDGNVSEVSAGFVSCATNSVDEINYLNAAKTIRSSAVNNSYLIIDTGYDITIVDENSNLYTIGVGGDLPTYFSADFAIDSDAENASETVILPDSESSYTIYPSDSVTEVSYMLEYNDSLLIVEGTSVDTIEITQTSVSVSGSDSDVSLGLVSNDGYYVTSWYKAELSAEGVDELTLSMSDVGYVVEGSDLSDITVYGTNDDETVELTFSTDKDTAIVTEDSAENMIVIIDEDDDGTYETVIATTDESER